MNLSQPKKKAKQWEDNDDGDVSIQDGKEDKDIDVVPITCQAMETPIEGKGMWERMIVILSMGSRCFIMKPSLQKLFP